MNWVEIDKNKTESMPDVDLWAYNSISEQVELIKEGVFLELGIYTHYQLIDKPNKPNA